ncbi:DUF554 domain-containing protein [Candidatus Planktophila sulfonica]|uniref:DUF554 domain-containing protein n=1 Tax=Candidatus Planktophila sulfonica TaxID=1884904 RepID=A0A249KGN3_9ACTN|nr:DUF554 domain-containing protein [Candidatus Planktophila sulfonica]ASY15952.1 DUF554 domain-containing protein [Candidatus Planktophila sulfonica]
MFAGLGTLINVIAIIIGSTIGIGAGSRLTKKSLSLITDILGLITLLGAASALMPLWSSTFIDSLPNGSTLLVILGAMLLGGLIGSALSLENRLDKFGETLRQKFKASSDGPFIEGFVSASLLFVIGPLAILGSVSDGMSEGLDQLILKSSLDFFAAMAFASSLGWGVAASAIPVAIYQGAWTLVGLFLGSVLQPYQIDAMTICGGLMLVGIGLRLLDIKKIAVANILPALIIAPVIATLLHQFI